MKLIKDRINFWPAFGIVCLGLIAGQSSAGVINVLDHGAFTMAPQSIVTFSGKITK